MLNKTESYLWDSRGLYKRLDGLEAFAQIGVSTVLSNSCVMAFVCRLGCGVLCLLKCAMAG